MFIGHYLKALIAFKHSLIAWPFRIKNRAPINKHSLIAWPFRRRRKNRAP
jgi:hypothetical protein